MDSHMSDLIPVTFEELEENFDKYLDKVQDGEVFLIDGKVVLTKSDSLEDLNLNV